MTQFDTAEHLIRVCQFLREPRFSSKTVKYFSPCRQYTLYSYELFTTIHFRNRIKFDLEKKVVYYFRTMVPTYEITTPHNQENHKLKLGSKFWPIDTLQTYQERFYYRNMNVSHVIQTSFMRQYFVSVPFTWKPLNKGFLETDFWATL
jgi:hypothetical protein